MRYLNENAIATVSGLTNPASSAVMASYLVNVSAQLVATGTIAGTLKLQASNDAKGNGNWSDITGASVAVSSAGVYLTVNLQAIGY